MFRSILFDLDGTLTRSHVGILRSVVYALSFFGIDESEENLYSFIGPPLHESFRARYGFDERTADEAVRLYRERYNRVGMFENEVYEGIPALLSDLHDAGRCLLLATSKPAPQALAILDHFDLHRFFRDDYILAASLDDRANSKPAVIARALSVLARDGQSREDAVMVGDRRYDVEGAAENGIAAIGAGYGYAAPGELEAAGALLVARDVPHLRQILFSVE